MKNGETLGFLAIDQHGEKITLTENKFPRKQLLNKTGYKHAAKMYIDTKDGAVKCIGYIIGKRWYTLYKVSEWVKNQ